MKLIICDDDVRFAELMEKQLEQICTDNHFSYSITVFHNPQLMLDKVVPTQDTIYFLDIDMPGLNGFQVTEALQARLSEVTIMFISGNNELVFSAFDYQPFHFIRKNHLKEELPRQLKRAVLKFKLDETEVLFTLDSGRKINLLKVKYAEVRGNYMYLHIEAEIIKLRKPIGQSEKEWGGYGFIRVHTSFLVNTRYIKGHDTQLVYLKDDTKIPISRSRLKEARTQMMEVLVNDG